MRARSQRVLLCLSLSLAASELLAQQPDAGAVYDQAAAAFERKDYRAAARGFAEADAIAPNPVALDSALKAVLLADDPVLGMELATRAESRKASLALAKDARAKFAGRTGELTIRCPDDPNCDVEIDRKPVRPGQRSWVLAGTRVVDVIVLGDKARHQLDVGPGASVEFAAPKPAPPPAKVEPPAAPPRVSVQPSARDRGGAHPAFFGVTIALFAGALGTTIWSGVDTLNIHSDFIHGEATAEEGKSAELRTNILLGVTLGGAAATVLVGIFTDWDGAPEKPREGRLFPTPTGLSVEF